MIHATLIMKVNHEQVIRPWVVESVFNKIKQAIKDNYEVVNIDYGITKAEKYYFLLYGYVAKGNEEFTHIFFI